MSHRLLISRISTSTGMWLVIIRLLVNNCISIISKASDQKWSTTSDILLELFTGRVQGVDRGRSRAGNRILELTMEEDGNSAVNLH